ncbi:ead/Ea22-like family protein [Klebsiella pneumoniae]|uniref:ead/Ea22-like family protein n=1 Tax=Klebsiella pneumoniae TaxID=573 RepID=UPI0015E23956|nr:ead/Ea22-like family protein [Klebsiella pneumoniae]HCQ7567824.1 ead/Ea22-like family protein [Klebsiella pneumoniae]
MNDITELAQSLKRRAASANEFGESLYVKADDVLALVEALEKAQQRIGKLEKKLTDHKRMNQEMAKAMLTPNDSDAAEMEIAALRQRIAGLESRTVKLPLPSCTYADHSYPAYTKQQVLTMLESLGVTVVEEDV